MKYEEKDIVDKIEKHDIEGLNFLFENYYKALCVYALRYLNSYDMAEDVVQEEFVAFWEKRKGTRFEGNLRSFLFTTIRNASLNLVKKSKKVDFIPIEEQVELVFDDFDFIEEEEIDRKREKIKKAVDGLPPKCKEVFLLIVVEEYKHKDVADCLNVSINTVRTQYARALKILHKELDLLLLYFIFYNSKFNK